MVVSDSRLVIFKFILKLYLAVPLVCIPASNAWLTKPSVKIMMGASVICSWLHKKSSKTKLHSNYLKRIQHRNQNLLDVARKIAKSKRQHYCSYTCENCYYTKNTNTLFAWYFTIIWNLKKQINIICFYNWLVIPIFKFPVCLSPKKIADMETSLTLAPILYPFYVCFEVHYKARVFLLQPTCILSFHHLLFVFTKIMQPLCYQKVQ